MVEMTLYEGQNLYIKFGFFQGDFAPDPLSPEGIWKSPRARRRARGPERRPQWGAKRRTEAGAEARGPGGVPEGIFKSPMGEGIWGKIHETKSEFYTYFFEIYNNINSEVVNQLKL